MGTLGEFEDSDADKLVLLVAVEVGLQAPLEPVLLLEVLPVKFFPERRADRAVQLVLVGPRQPVLNLG